MYKRVDPVDIKYMKKTRFHGHFTICEKLREIYMATDDEDIQMKARIAMAMAKKMHERLKWYRDNTAEKEIICLDDDAMEPINEEDEQYDSV